MSEHLEKDGAGSYPPETLHRYAQQLADMVRQSIGTPTERPLAAGATLEPDDVQYMVPLDVAPDSPLSAAWAFFVTSPDGELRWSGIDMELSRPRYHYWRDPEGKLGSVRVERWAVLIGPDGVQSSANDYYPSALVEASDNGPAWVRGAAEFGFLSAGTSNPRTCPDEGAARTQVWQTEHADAEQAAVGLLSDAAVRYGLEPLGAFAETQRRIRDVDNGLAIRSLDRRPRNLPF